MVEESSYSSVGFFNVFGIIVTVVWGFLFFICLARTLMFLKKLMYKLRIIMKNSYIIERTSLGLPIDTGNRSEEYSKYRDTFREEIMRSWNLRFFNVFSYVLDRYNHLFYLMICCKKKHKENMSLLKPQFSFNLMIWFIPIFIIWLLSIFLVGIDLTMSSSSAIGYAILSAIIGSLFSVWLTFWFHYFWTK